MAFGEKVLEVLELRPGKLLIQSLDILAQATGQKPGGVHVRLLAHIPCSHLEEPRERITKILQPPCRDMDVEGFVLVSC